MSKSIYLDNAATVKMSDAVFSSLSSNKEVFWGNASSNYLDAKTAQRGSQKAREVIARQINAKPNEIFFTSGATESNNWAMQIGMDLCEKVITTPIEHKSIYRSPALKNEKHIETVRVDKNGRVDDSDLCLMISKYKRALFSVIAINNETGTEQNLSLIGYICNKNNWYLHVDASQAIGKMEIDVKEQNIAMLSGSGHKIGAPRGIGFLYIREDIQPFVNPIISGGSQQFGLRGGTEPIELEMSLGVAIKEANRLVYIKRPHYETLNRVVVDSLKSANIEFDINCNEYRHPAIMNILLYGINAASLVAAADMHGVEISQGSACDSDSIKPSHVLEAIGLTKTEALSSIRISFSPDTQVDEVVEGMKRLILAINDVKNAMEV